MRILVMLLLAAGPTVAGQPVSGPGAEAVSACLSAYPPAFPADQDQKERYAFVEAEDPAESRWYRIGEGEKGWSSGAGEVLEHLELTFRSGQLIRLQNTLSTEHFSSLTEICFHETDDPAVSLESHGIFFDWICDENGDRLGTGKIVTVEKLTRLAPGGLFSVETRLFLGGTEYPPERFCGPAAFLHDLHQPSLYLVPIDRLLAGGFSDMRENAPLLEP